MAKINTVIDSSFLFVIFHKQDPMHQAAQAILRDSSRHFLIPQIVLTETAYLMNRFGGIQANAAFMRAVSASGIALEAVGVADLLRGAEIMLAYPTAKLDFVDCCIVAIAERLNAPTVCSLDRRDFSIIRTQQGQFLEILP